MSVTKESIRLKEDRERGGIWKRWGPYLSERQWGTVREDYSETGDAWNHFSHDQARSRTYRWGEDGLAGFSDDRQQLCFSLALWNGVDPILKERLFGLTNTEGNHGEDVKEYYFYLDATPTHSYLKYLYKYPQRAFPYDDLVRTNRLRTRAEMEYELLDTGVFDDSRYFDVFVEYAKASPDDILIMITVWNRGPEAASLDVLPTLWFRNTWQNDPAKARPVIDVCDNASPPVLRAIHDALGERYLHLDRPVELLFTDNETNRERVFGTPNVTPYQKDGINNFVVHGQTHAVNPKQQGTKVAARYQLTIPEGGSETLSLRLCVRPPGRRDRRRSDSGDAPVERILNDRRLEADEFYATVIPDTLQDDDRRIMRQALAGMIWSKQHYHLDVDTWLREHHGRVARNVEWYHLVNDDIISMPDKWEYPWYAAWDLAFHAVPLALVDVEFAKRQLSLLLDEQYQHPNGQLPAYEWNFNDVNPPVHAWSTFYVYNLEKEAKKQGDLVFLERAFQKLLMNFTWWVNRRDRTGRNLFDGGFLGLDNIGVFDRSKPLPGGGWLEQADGTAWIAMFCQNMFDIAIELALRNSASEQLAYKFLEHFFWIAAAMDRVGDHRDELWDEEDGFFYDVMRLPGGEAGRVRLRSMVGLLPMCATTVIEETTQQRFPGIFDRAKRFLERRPDLVETMAITPPGEHGRVLLTVVNEKKLRRILSRMLDENEFLGRYGVRSLSRTYRDNPFKLTIGPEVFSVRYEPAESSSAMFGGNSNWRGPIWLPINALILRALLQYYMYFGDGFTIECPTGSGRQMTLFEVAREIAGRIRSVFKRDDQGRRPVFGGAKIFQTDPHWQDQMLFYEYFNGDDGAGLGASHQTGWTGLIARFMQMEGLLEAGDVLKLGRGASAVTARGQGTGKGVRGAA